MKKIVFLFLILILILYFLAPVLMIVGCAPSDRLIIRPDIYVSGNFYPYSYYPHYPYYYGAYYVYSGIVVKNGSDRLLKIGMDGQYLFDLLPGEEKAARIRVDYSESRQIVITASGYKETRLKGTASRIFNFYGSANQKRMEIWHIYNWDLRDP